MWQWSLFKMDMNIKVGKISNEKIKEANEIFKDAVTMAIQVSLRDRTREIFKDVEEFYNNNEHTSHEEELKAWFKLKDKWLK